MTRSKRSFGPDKREEILPVISAFHRNLQIWIGEIPINSRAYLALSFLKAALLLTSDTIRDDVDRMYMRNSDGGEPPG